MNAAVETGNLSRGENTNLKHRDGMLKDLQDLRDMLEELYEKNVKLDEENCSLKKEVNDMKGHIGNVLETMRVLKQDLKKAQELLNKPKPKAKLELAV